MLLDMMLTVVIMSILAATIIPQFEYSIEDAHDAVLVNVARGEVVNETALAGAIDRLRGVALDVYVGEFDHAPPATLWNHPRVLLTPHVSAGSDNRTTRPIELFCENLRAFLDDEPLRNVIDWDRGY